MVQQSDPDDFVLATGTSTSVKEWLDGACSKSGLDPADKVVIQDRLMRPSEVDDLVGDASKAEKVLGWKPQVMPDQLLEIMLHHDRELISKPSAVDSIKSPLWTDIVG
jgi:GDPmannose 4,6-dehydratase